MFGKRKKSLRMSVKPKPKRRVTTYALIGEGWHKQGKKVRFKSLRLRPESVALLNSVLKAGLPLNLTVMPNPKHESDPVQPPLRVFLVFTRVV